MARFSHKDVYIEVASVEITGRSNSCEISIDVGLAEVTCFEEAWSVFVEDPGAWTIDVAGFTDQDAANVEDTLFAMKGAGAQAIDYRPQGETSGYKFTGNVFLKSFKVGGGLTGGCAFSASFQGTDTLSRTSVT